MDKTIFFVVENFLKFKSKVTFMLNNIHGLEFSNRIYNVTKHAHIVYVYK